MTKPIVYIVIYSLYHHVYKLSLSIKEGLESKGVDVQLFQVQETLSDDILSKMQAPQKPDLPIITVDKLPEADGIFFGLPTRFGTMPAQVKALLDSSGAIWAKGGLAGKFAATFFSTASQHGGQETTALTAVTYFAHHGMLYVPFGYSNAGLNNIDEVVGGSAYGCGTVSDGDGSRQPTQIEMDIAKNQGSNFGTIISTFVNGRDGTAVAGSNTANAAATGSANTSTNTSNVPTSTTDAVNRNVGSAVPTDNSVDPNTAATTSDPSKVGTSAGTIAAATAGVAVVGAGKGKETVNPNDSTTNGTATGATKTDVVTADATATGPTTAADKNNATNTATGVAYVPNTVTAVTTDSADTTTGAGEDINNATNANMGAVTGAITGAATTDASTTGAPKTASGIGSAAGATAAGNATAVQDNVLNKVNKPKKSRKWFCCG